MELRSVSSNNYLKFSGRTGEWSWGGETIANPVFLADLKNLAEGWIYFPPAEGASGLNGLFDPDGGWPPCPSPEHKQGVLLRLKIQGAITSVSAIFTVTANSAA